MPIASIHYSNCTSIKHFHLSIPEPINFLFLNPKQTESAQKTYSPLDKKTLHKSLLFAFISNNIFTRTMVYFRSILQRLAKAKP